MRYWAYCSKGDWPELMFHAAAPVMRLASDGEISMWSSEPTWPPNTYV